MEEVKYQFALGSEQFIERIKNAFLKDKDLKQYSSPVRKIENPKTVQEICGIVAKEYNVDMPVLLKMRAKHKEARQVMIDLCYQAHLRKKSLIELGAELGGISGAGVVRVHKRLIEKIGKDKVLAGRVLKLKNLCNISV